MYPVLVVTRSPPRDPCPAQKLANLKGTKTKAVLVQVQALTTLATNLRGVPKSKSAQLSEGSTVERKLQDPVLMNLPRKREKASVFPALRARVK